MCFCIKALAQLFAFGFLPLKTINLKKQKQCAACGQDKNHDENKCRRDGLGSKQKGDACRDGGILLTWKNIKSERRNLYLEIIFISCSPLYKNVL